MIVFAAHAKVLAGKLPEWDPDGRGCDMYYWYYGTLAMFQAGGDAWKQWLKAMESAIVDSQRPDASGGIIRARCASVPKRMSVRIAPGTSPVTICNA